jgi:nitric oxide dioxygenase
MLDAHTIAVVKSTAPVLQEHGEALTRHFYKRMFAQNPEMAAYFNPAHQTAGVQQRALASAICAYAANIDNLEVLGGAVELIAQKHASLQIKPEHYPIIGANLLASIREVLGKAATNDILDAWAEAYEFLAGILIGRETQIYREHAAMPGGWVGFKPFRIIRKEVESDVISSFYLVPADGEPIPDYKPGQYVTVRAPTPNGLTTMRNYSLSSKPTQEWLRISVKREPRPEDTVPDGFMSHFLHRQVDVGATLEVAPPCGEFFLDVSEKHKRPLVLLAAGIGVTPILAILHSALDAMPERPIIFIHAVLNERTQAFRDTIDALAAQNPNLKTHYRYSELAGPGVERSGNCSSGLIDAELIESMVPSRDADYYFCGPQPFMVTIYYELLTWGIPPAQVHFEFFGPRQELERPRIDDAT